MHSKNKHCEDVSSLDGAGNYKPWEFENYLCTYLST